VAYRITSATRSAPRRTAPSVLGPGTLRKRLISFAFLLGADERGIGRLGARPPRRAADKFALSRKLRVATFVRRNGCRQEIIHLRADLLLPHLKVIVPPRMLLAWLLSNLMPGNSCPPARRICANRSIMFFNWIALLN